MSYGSDRVQAAELPKNPRSAQLGGSFSEVSPPEAIQALNQVLVRYQPQVKILDPKPEQLISDNTVTVRLQVKDLPVFKDAKLGLGPHLSVILDNQAFTPVYDLTQPLILKDLEAGTHTLRVFAARPWDESFKNEGAYAQATFHIFTKTESNNPSPTQPLLTYNLPAGSYGAEPILLDFYLTNAPLRLVAQGASGKEDVVDWQIRCTVNGQNFVLDRWQSLYLKGFKPGKNWVQLELIDEQGKSLPNVFNSTVRVINYDPDSKDTLARLVRGELKATQAKGIVETGFKPSVASPAVAPAPSVSPSPRPTAIATPSDSSSLPLKVAPPAPTAVPTPRLTSTPIPVKSKTPEPKTPEPVVENPEPKKLPQPVQTAVPSELEPAQSTPKAAFGGFRKFFGAEPKPAPQGTPTLQGTPAVETPPRRVTPKPTPPTVSATPKPVEEKKLEPTAEKTKATQSLEPAVPAPIATPAQSEAPKALQGLRKLFGGQPLETPKPPAFSPTPTATPLVEPQIPEPMVETIKPTPPSVPTVSVTPKSVTVKPSPTPTSPSMPLQRAATKSVIEETQPVRQQNATVAPQSEPVETSPQSDKSEPVIQKSKQPQSSPKSSDGSMPELTQPFSKVIPSVKNFFNRQMPKPEMSKPEMSKPDTVTSQPAVLPDQLKTAPGT
jgi:hypothetical protein